MDKRLSRNILNGETGVICIETERNCRTAKTPSSSYDQIITRLVTRQRIGSRGTNLGLKTSRGKLRTFAVARY